MSIKSLEDLRKIKAESQLQTKARKSNDTQVIIGMGTCGIAAGAREIMQNVLVELEKRGLKSVSVETTGCIGMCQQEPLLDVIRPGEPRITYGRLTVADVPRIVAEHVVNGNIVEDRVIGRTE